MRTLRELYPEFKEQVTILALGYDPTESLGELEADARGEGYPFPVGVAPRQMVLDYGVLIRSTKVGIGKDGVVTFRSGYGVSPAETWRAVLRHLAEG